MEGRLGAGDAAHLVDLCLFVAVIKYHEQKQLMEERFYFSLKLSGHTPSLREVQERFQSTNLKARTEVEAMEEHCFLAFSPWLFSLLSYGIQNHLSRGGTTVGWVLLQQSLIKNMPDRLSIS